MVVPACGKDGDKTTAPKPTTTEISGPISASGTWSGTVRLTANADIAAGVHINVAAGTVFEGAQDAMLQVHGDLAINGTAGAPVSMQPVLGATAWGGIVVESGGAASIHHANGTKVATLLTCKTGALASVIDSASFNDLGQALDASSQVSVSKSTFTNLSTDAMVVKVGGNVTVADCVLWGAPGDLVIVNGGQLDISYCNIGSSTSSQHGDIFVSSSTGLNVSYCNIASAEDGLSLGGSTGQVEYNNLLNNNVDVVDLGSNTSICLCYDYWDGGAPALGGAFTVLNPSPSPIASAGPR
jgi:hypothetical protein